MNKILTTTGYKDLSQLQVGDKVVAYLNGETLINDVLKIDFKTGSFKSYIINETWNLYELQSIWVNDNVQHAQDLQIGDVIYNDEDKDITITSIEESTVSEWYRLTISNNHSYIIDGLTLHNASRYWVGGGSSTSYSGSSNTNWSASSGGANNASVPASTDDVFFDGQGAGGQGNCSINSDRFIKNLDMTGYTGTLNISSSVTWSASGNTWKLSTGMTLTYGSVNTSLIEFASGDGIINIYTYGKTIPYIKFNDASSTFTLQDDMTITGFVDASSSTSINLNGKTLTCNTFVQSSGNINLDAGNLVITGYDEQYSTYVFYIAAGTVTCGTSTIKFTDSSSNNKTLETGDKTFYNVWFSGTGSGYFYIRGTNTWSNIKIDAGRTLRLQTTKTQTYYSLTARGTASSTITIRSYSVGTNVTMTKIGGGIVALDYCAINDIAAGGTGANFYAGQHSTLSGGSGFVATNPPSNGFY